MKHPLQQAEFLTTSAEDAQLPQEGAAEIAFAGRSNAGKSSAINTLANRTRLAFTSKTPGRTQHINFFQLRSGALLADLPGYGYAAVPQELKRHWQQFLARYVATRQTLVGLVLVIDIRHGVAALDIDLLDTYLPSGRPVLVLATKADKLTPSAARVAVRELERTLHETFAIHASRIGVIAFSSLRRIGVEDAEAVLGGWLGTDTDVPDGAPSDRRTTDSSAPAAKKKRPRGQGE
ncbi:MAG: ribosome biogenesis GTP-binding protein YihA/YsxC [Pseudomonadota bacterium]|nr:ribosome biogenesis GTP-binding protein YihA/YsxC [Pseudomonadota bacterium]